MKLLCPICHEPKALSDALCKRCTFQLDSECFDASLSRCPVCLYPKVSDDYVCQRCKTETRYRIYPVARYDGRLSYSVLDSFKFHGHKEMAAVVASYLGRALDALDPQREALIVPIPCSKERRRRFGWDQMDLVCKALGRPFLHLIENAKDGLQQKKLNRMQRLETSGQRFRLNARYVHRIPELRGRRLIVVDDMVTTMSTMESALRTLEDNGFVELCGASWLGEL